MKAKYYEYGNDCIIYNQVICEDNIVVTVEYAWGSWCSNEPETKTVVCKNEEEAINLYNNLCDKLVRRKCHCEYRN